MPTDTGLLLRPAAAEDLPAVAELFLVTRAAAVPAMPALVHAAPEVRAHIEALDLDERGREMWVAELAGGTLAGFAELRDAWLDDLYVHPEHQGAGVGAALLDVVKAERPTGFCLWVFESNTPARTFYERRGLVSLERTDGSGNEERSPDVRMAWPGTEPLAFFRGLIDEVDAGLGDLLARRAALTRVVQDHKAALGDAERDLDREARVAEALAARAPELGVDRLRRIVHAIITESIDAARA